MIHQIRYAVALRDDNLDGTSRSFDCLSGVSGQGVYATEDRLLDAGTIIGALSSVPDSFDQKVVLYEVTDDGPLNRLDAQPERGDFVVSLCPPSDLVFQAGMFALIVDDDGHVATISIGLLLTLFPLFAQDWLAQVPAMLGEALNVLNIPAQIAAAVSDATVHRARFVVFATPENLDGTSHTVTVPESGNMVEHTVAEGDTVLCITGFREDVPMGAVVELRTVTALPDTDGENSSAPEPWPIAGQIRQGDLFMTTGDTSPDNIGLILVAPFDGVLVAAQSNVLARIIGELTARVDALTNGQQGGGGQGGGGGQQGGPAPVWATAPSNVTPMEDWTWDGTDNVLCSADTSNRPITVFVPPAEDTDEVPADGDQPAVPARRVVNHTLIVQNRNGANDVTIAVNAAEDHQSDIIVPPGHAATIRAIYGSYMLLAWL